MKDVEYVKAVLSEDFETEHSHEIPYPDLSEVVRDGLYEYLAGTVDGETPNGSKSREGHDYLWFQCGKKSILTHRFIAAVTLGKWVPRDFDVDHVNHNPSDNRPINLRIVTRRDNAGNRRRALLSELADLDAVSRSLKERKPLKIPSPEPNPVADHSSVDMSFGGPIPQTTFTGETKPAKHGGTWHKTNLGSWHLRFD
ncbi:HNH endonuclease signature motif containing protein [uncultured Roseobacter sp.]|uniref:HNH endonuclease signature motif containing protein n=1 Tax=uncultured Roseobacter sp. TaxID=114847 RepID=UPI00261B0E22|nr:HNH endonuclease signature motif containing protein [uncultured Roseobacter sp.]